MKIHKQKDKAQLVCDMAEMQYILIALAESPNLKVRKLAFKMREAFEDLAKRESNKK